VNVTAVTIAESCEQPALLARDVSWLWRTAYNCAIQACSDWEDREDQISDIFDAARRVSDFLIDVFLGLITLRSFLNSTLYMQL
jgi:hypothetical protein